MPVAGPYGGEPGENTFSVDVPDNSNFRISGISVWVSNYVDALQLYYVNLTNNERFTGLRHGGPHGGQADITFAPTEVLTGIIIQAGAWIDALQFFTNTGAQYRFGGTGAVNNYPFTAPNEILGFEGTYGNDLNTLAIHYK